MSMSGAGFDELAKAINEVLGLARSVREQVLDVVIPALPPARRTFAEWLARELERDGIIVESRLNDLDAFIDVLERAISAGTHVGWEADEHHVQGGYTVVHCDEQARALLPVVVDLRKLGQAIARVLDTARAQSLAGTMTND
ncbi:hypothetical protein [Pararhodobacter sp. SW119]|uniref:hypothetical protein n=1 Tax=Pararhodobacter sp. SW119 TaxID=2780075 RepID=UPI001AE06008|nr:hypothetical protein [Pararhodobacter sp. SW119]